MKKKRSGDNDVIQAAGGLVWRDAADGPEILIVHRPRYDDWSLPKGKMESGESWAETAIREVEEETGLEVALEAFAGSCSYLVRKRVKVVLFWNMSVRQDNPFVPNVEVDALKWVPVEEALEALDYEFERDVLRDASSVKRLR